jgi:hypothetical protein
MLLNVSPHADLAAAKAAARDAIDQAAGAARSRYITTVHGQEATYIAKYQQALEYVAAGYPTDVSDYPWIAAEAEHTGLTPRQCADRCKEMGDAWANAIGPAIEGLRIGGKDHVTAAVTVVEVNRITGESIAALDAV